MRSMPPRHIDVAPDIARRPSERAADLNGLLIEARDEGQVDVDCRRSAVRANLPAAKEILAAWESDGIAGAGVDFIGLANKVQQVRRHVRPDLEDHVPRIAQQ